MSPKSNTPIDVVGLREKLSHLTYDKLKAEAEVLGVISIWKNGINKQTAVENVIKAYVAKVELENSTKPVEVVSEEEEGTEFPVDSIEEIPEGEYDVDEDTLIEYPVLIEMGFSIGDILVVEIGRPWSKKEVEYNGSPDDREDDLINGVPRSEINKELANLNGGLAPVEKTDEEKKPIEEIEVEEEVETGEYVPEIIDESKYSIEELEENIQICQANCYQSLPATRIHLLRKIDALQLALDRKQK